MTINWRDIKGEDVNWWDFTDTYRQSSKIVLRFKPTGNWAGLTLGEICDKGITSWNREVGWGPKTTEELKMALRKIAKNPEHAINKRAYDAFNPEKD